MNVKQAQKINLEFYETSYSSRCLVKALLKQFLSYDQLSKTRRNLAMLSALPEFSRPLLVLDYGFGHGTLLLRMPRRHTIAGCEISPSAAENLRRLGKLLRRNIALFTCDGAANLPINFFDLVCCSHVIEHVEDEIGLLHQFHQALRAGGHILLNVPINEVWRDPKHVRAYSAESISESLRIAGFEILRLQEADRWTAYILSHEYVLNTKPRLLFRLLRLLLAVLPVWAQNASEALLPSRYACQQLLVLAKKA